MLAVCSELLSGGYSLIHGKIQGILSISGPWRLLGPSNLNRLAAKFPIQQNREFNRKNSEFFLRNREAYGVKKELSYAFVSVRALHKVRRRARIATDKPALRERVLLATVRLAAQASIRRIQ